MIRRRGVCCKCQKPVAFRVQFSIPAEPAQPSELSEPTEPTESGEPAEPTGARFIGRFYSKPRPNPFLGDYQPPNHTESDVCADHVDFFKDIWEGQGSEVRVTPIQPPSLPKGHHVRPKRGWEGGFTDTHARGYGIWIECETLSPESAENRTVTLFLDEDDIVALMRRLKEAARDTRSQSEAQNG